ncbi:hypothetical protein [Chryseobacterium wanjuense]
MQRRILPLPRIYMFQQGLGGTDFIFNSNIAKLDAGSYFLFVRYGSGATACTSVKTRAGAANGFTITLLK